MSDAPTTGFAWSCEDQVPTAFADTLNRGLAQLLGAAYARNGGDTPPTREELTAVVGELEEAATRLEQARTVCQSIATGLRPPALRRHAAEANTARRAERLKQAVGRRAVVTQSSIPRLQCADVELVSVNGSSAIVRDPYAFWEVPVNQLLVVPPMDAESGKTRASDGHSTMYLELGQGDLGGVIQFLTMTSRSGELDIRFPHNGDSGRIFVERCRVVHAEYLQERGVEAIARMLAEPQGKACFTDGQRPARQTIAKGADQLLLEAAVLADEMAAAPHG